MEEKEQDKEATDGQSVWHRWLAEVMTHRPKQNMYLDSPRGMEVTKMGIEHERKDFTWHRSDEDTFWIDIQLFVKYKLSDKEIKFIMKQQPGVDNYRKHAADKNAYAEFMRGLEKLRKLESNRPM